MKMTITVPASSGHDIRVYHETLFGNQQAVLRGTVDGAGLLISPGGANLALLTNGEIIITAHFDFEGFQDLVETITASGTCELSQVPTGHLSPLQAEWITVED